MSVTVSGDNVIDISLDNMGDVTIEHCIAVDKAVHAAFDQDAEDYELTVGSYGLTSPLLVLKQYEKNMGKEVEVLTCDGRKLHGTLTHADNERFTISTPTKMKVEGKKRPEIVDVETTLLYSEVKYTKCIIKI